MKTPRFLVTGANGQVGFELRRSLALYGEVIPVSSSDCNLADAAAVRAMVIAVAPTVIVNPAAYTAVDKAQSEPDLAHAVNAIAPRVLAEAAVAVGAGFVHYSTDYVFDGTGDRPWRESDPTAPLNVYGQTKLDGERAVLGVFAGTDLPHWILRTSWVFGAHGNNFLKTMLRLSMQRDSLAVVADQFGAPTSAALLADVTARLWSRQPPGGLYHLSAGGWTNWHGFAQRAIARARQHGLATKVAPEAIRELVTSEYPTPAQRPLNSRLDCSAICQALDLTLPDWSLAVDQTTDILVENKGLIA